MAKINRSDIIQKAVNDLAISIANDKVPTETLDKVQLTYSLNKQFSSWICGGGSGNSGNAFATIPNPGERGEVYLTSLTAHLIKDAACDMATGSVSVSITPADTSLGTQIITFGVITLTAQDELISLNLPYPLKIKTGVNPITFSGTFTAGVCQRRITATGFIQSSN